MFISHLEATVNVVLHLISTTSSLLFVTHLNFSKLSLERSSGSDW